MLSDASVFSGDDRVSEAMKSTASNMEVLQAEVKAASQAISQTLAASGAQQTVHRGHARALHDFGPAAFAGARGGNEGETETAEMMVSGITGLYCSLVPQLVVDSLSVLYLTAVQMALDCEWISASDGGAAAAYH